MPNHFEWLLGLNGEDDAFDHSGFAKNRERLLKHKVSWAVAARYVTHVADEEVCS